MLDFYFVIYFHDDLAADEDEQEVLPLLNVEQFRDARQCEIFRVTDDAFAQTAVMSAGDGYALDLFHGPGYAINTILPQIANPEIMTHPGFEHRLDWVTEQIIERLVSDGDLEQLG